MTVINSEDCSCLGTRKRFRLGVHVDESDDNTRSDQKTRFKEISADHLIYYYNLRNMRAPLCTLVGHNKTVSYMKFIDNVNLVSASTDNTLKLWDLSTCTSRVIDFPIQSFTSHTNVKNFVGLSVSEGYIATGS
ncbi:hypothetical protein RYX36_025488 [Vicia faba]